MRLKIRCLTNGARIAGRVMRANQELDDEFDAEQVAQLGVLEAAGDISISGAPEALEALAAHRKAAEEKRAEAQKAAASAEAELVKAAAAESAKAEHEAAEAPRGRASGAVKDSAKP